MAFTLWIKYYLCLVFLTKRATIKSLKIDKSTNKLNNNPSIPVNNIVSWKYIKLSRKWRQIIPWQYIRFIPTIHSHKFDQTSGYIPTPAP